MKIFTRLITKIYMVIKNIGKEVKRIAKKASLFSTCIVGIVSLELFGLKILEIFWIFQK